MKRQTAKSYENLIFAGIELAGDYGLEGFNIRQLCAKAGVNLGMFHCYFKTKSAFDKIIFKKVYADLISNINVQLSSQNNPKENIRLINKIYDGFYETNKGLLFRYCKTLSAETKGPGNFCLQILQSIRT